MVNSFGEVFGERMRYYDTRRHVVETLTEMMEELPIEKVKVTELCRRAEIGRTTFYDCFDDVFGVVRWYWDGLMQNTLCQIGLTLDYREGHRRAFEEMLRAKPLLVPATKSVEYGSLVQYGGREMTSHIIELYRRKSGHEPTAEQLLRLEYNSVGNKHMTRHWIARGMVESPETMADLFVEFVPEFLVPYLEPM